MIKFKNIEKKYELGDEVIMALDDVNLTIEEKEFVAVLGPSGSGKSTLMNIMGCLDMPTSGEYYLDDQIIEAYADDELAAIRNKKIGFIFQSFNLLNKMTIKENVELPLIYQGIHQKDREKMVDDALEQVGLSHRKKHTPSQISGGQQQRAAIARAIVTGPSIILADEPTGNLDSKTGTEIMGLFRDLNDNGRTIILITHDEQTADIAERQLHIIDGKITEDLR